MGGNVSALALTPTAENKAYFSAASGSSASPPGFGHDRDGDVDAQRHGQGQLLDVVSGPLTQLQAVASRTPRDSAPAGTNDVPPTFVVHHSRSKLRDFPVLDNLATDIISSFARSTLPEIRAFVAKSENDVTQAYQTRRNLFNAHLRVYSNALGFIEPAVSRDCTPAQQDMIRRINKATFILTFFENLEDRSRLLDLSHRFLDTFVSPAQKLLLWHGAIFLELKTQAYISCLTRLRAGGLPATAYLNLLDSLLPDDIDAEIVDRHPETRLLAPSELDFVDRARARKQYLLAEPRDTAAEVLAAKYSWQDFVRDFFVSVSKNLDSILDTSKQPSVARNQALQPRSLSESTMEIRDPEQKLGRANTQDSGPTEFASRPDGDTTPEPIGLLTPKRISHHTTMDGRRVTSDPDSGRGMLNASFSSRYAHNFGGSSHGGSTDRDTRGPSTAPASYSRQVWSTEEEQALMLGLGRVGGPFWSQILSLYGPGGSVSEVLKDRNQVQLKDKARNLKLWYLKTGGNDPEKVPECLRCVTGELRKRGGLKFRAAYETSRVPGPCPSPPPSSTAGPRYRPGTRSGESGENGEHGALETQADSGVSRSRQNTPPAPISDPDRRRGREHKHGPERESEHEPPVVRPPKRRAAECV